MKTTTSRLLSLAMLAIVPACSKKPVNVTGQVFVVTKGRENIKMGGLEVRVIPDAEFLNMAKATVPWMQEEARKEAQWKTDADFLTAFIHEVQAMEEAAPNPIPELPIIRKAIVEESGSADSLLKSALSAGILPRGMGMLMSGASSTLSASTDADGRFTVPIIGKTWFIAAGQREVGEQTEEYLWLKGFEAPADVTSATMAISNEADIDSEDGLYSLLTQVIGAPGELEGFRKVEVSEKMKSMVTRHREAANAAKEKSEREAAEAKAKAEAAYAEASGKRAGEEKIIEISPGVTMTFCWCPAGKFTMGSPPSEADRSKDEDQVEVTLSRGFWMAKTEVTQAQWLAVMGANPSHFKGTDRPVEEVSWENAQEFLSKINAIVGNSDGGKMVLPTEAQWEYAARAGEAGRVSGGTLDDVAWYRGNSGSETHPVGTKQPNAWGLHDMIGNVSEWCADCYESELEGGVDPRGAASGTDRVLRGGSWLYYAGYCRVASRYGDGPSCTSGSIGFRVARSSVP
ncbi:MAG: formylglycine-generating enzyme family protein [Akkermansiaceae bacterium]|nr:formylglycine-generating enzyme family protein [Akkermansiaceae bacterium]